MASSRVEKLAKAVAQLENSIENTDTTSKKNQNIDKVRILCTEVKDIIVTNDFNSVYKEDNRYADQVNKAIQTVFKLINHPEQNTRTFAEEMLDSILRSLLLGFHQYRVLVCLISEINRNTLARSLVAAYIRLTSLIHLVKTNRAISYGVHIAHALGTMLKRPEESVQQAIVQHTPRLFTSIGQRMRDQQTEKLFALYQIAAENLDLSGTANRAAVTVISQICTYNASILQKAFIRCSSNIRSTDEFECKSRLVGSLNILKNIWPIIHKCSNTFQEDMLKMCIASTVCCLYSKQSEIVVAVMEFLEVVFNYPLKAMNSFDPTDFSALSMWKPLLTTDRISLSASNSKLESDNFSLKSFSTLDISNTESPEAFNTPLVFPDSPRYHNEDNNSDSDVTETGADEEIIDPLMHAELYEEVNRPETPPMAIEMNDSPFHTPGKNSSIPVQPPTDVCVDGSDFYVYTAATLGKIFLLAGLKGLKNDRDVRISHKLLALNSLTSISKKHDLFNVIVTFEDTKQPLIDVVRFVLHEDDQLCASTLQFMASLDKWHPSYGEYYVKVASSFQVIRKRALLQAFIGEQILMNVLGLTEILLDLAISQANSTYFLIQISCAEFLANVDWNTLDVLLRKKYQKNCLKSYFELLFATDPKVSKAAVECFPKIVRNANLSKFTSAFKTGLPSEPLSNTGLIPAVLNLSKEFNFFNESADYTIESNLEVVIQELTNFYLHDSEIRSSTYCAALEVLMESFPPTIYYEVWGGVSKTASPTPVIVTSILDKCEASLCSPFALTTGLNVIGKLFAGMCEGYMVQIVREQATVERSSLPRLPDPPILDRILLLSLRTINMYYALIAEHRSTISQASAFILNRPTMSPILSKKPSPNRIADISHLMGTSVHPSRKSSFLESFTLNSIFPSIQGSYSNYLESLSRDNEQKFCGLLHAAINCLSCICEMLSFQQLKPVLEEILLYIKVLLEVAPAPASSLLHQMFKVVFGKNAANINLNCLNALKMRDPLPPRTKEEMFYIRYANEFTTFSSLIGRKDYISSFIHRELGWLKSDMLSKVYVQTSTEISIALEPFEGFVTQLRHIYNSYQSIPFKKSVLGVMCELPRNGIIYSMADPKKILLDIVIQQTQDPSFGNMELLTEIILFLIVLARTNVLKFEHIVKIGSDLIEKANEHNGKYILQAVRVIVLELLYVQQVELDILYISFNTRSKDLFHYAADETLFLWMLLLHMTDKTSQKTMSIDFFGNFSEFMSSDDESYNCSFTLSAASLSMMSPSMFLPIDNFFKQLQKFINDECPPKKYWGRVTITFFILLHAVEEDPLLLRLEDLVPEPLNWLSTTIVRLIEKGVSSVATPEFPVETFTHFLQTFVALCKSERYKKLSCSMIEELEDASLDKDALKANWRIYSQILQLFKFSPRFYKIVEFLKPKDGNPSYIHNFYDIFAIQKEDMPKDYVKIRYPAPIERDEAHAFLFSKGTDDEIYAFLFKNDAWDDCPGIYQSVLLSSTASLYSLLNSMILKKRTQFLINLCKEMGKQLRVNRENKELCIRFQEFLDFVEDFIRIKEESSYEEVVSSLEVLNVISEIIQIEQSLLFSKISPVQLARYFEYQPINTLGIQPIKGLQFILSSEAVRQEFINKPLNNLIEISDILRSCSAKFIANSVKKCSTSENFTLHCQSEGLEGIFGTRTAEDVICELFDLVQHIIYNLQHGSHYFPPEHITLLRILCRHPVLHSLAMVPLTAFKMQWDLEIRASPSGVHVPLVNIHMLCNIDVLQDFSWRINWVGWNSRQEFEDYWMSLFGVLSSTPTGAEIADGSNVLEQILASSLSVSALTDILLYTLLFPEPGNIPVGSFVVKAREKNGLFYESKAMTQLRFLIGKARNVKPEILYMRNLERVDESGKLYNLGQLCAMSLWTLTGDLRSVKKDSPDRVKISLSEYLLKTTSELDTGSSVRALFENFSHWFSRGLEFLPLPLLSSTIRAMVFLCDLFDEAQSYEFLYAQIKIVYRGGYLADHSDLGYVIYALLKTATVIGIDSVERTMTEADVAKLILAWVETGLISNYPFVRTATLHGILYILQSMAAEALKPVYQYVASFLNAEITEISTQSESENLIENSVYENLLWTVSFRLMEEPMQVNLRNNMNKIICTYISSSPSNIRMMEIVTSGAEELILHSASYVPQYLEIVSHCFKEYATMMNTFPYILRIFTVCVFREEMDPRRTQAGKFAIPLEELLSLYRRVDKKDGKRISKVLVSILLRLQTEEQAMTTIFDLLSGHSLYNNVKSTLTMVYEFFQRLRETKRTSTLLEFSRFAVNKSKSAFIQEDHFDHFISTSILFASSPKDEIANRFFFVLNVPHEPLSSSSFKQLLSLNHEPV